MKRHLKLMGLAAAIIVSGCKPEPNEAKSGGGSVPKSDRIEYAALSNDQAIVTVDGVALTKGDLELTCAIRGRLARITDRRLTVEKLEQIKMRTRQQAVREFMLRQAVLSEADRRQIVVDDSEFADFERRFLAGLSKKGKPITMAQVTNDLPAATAAAFVDDLRKDCRYQKLFAIMREEARSQITQAEAERRFATIKRYNERAHREESKIYADATNVYERLKSGETFESLVDEMSGQTPRIDADMDWGTFQREFFANDPEIHRLLGEMREGEFSPPVTGNNGLIIFRLNKTIAPDKENDPGGDYYHLGKIFFSLPEFFELTDSTNLRARIEREISEEKFQRKLLQLQASCKVVHPNGVVIMPQNKATNKAR